MKCIKCNSKRVIKKNMCDENKLCYCKNCKKVFLVKRKSKCKSIRSNIGRVLGKVPFPIYLFLFITVLIILTAIVYLLVLNSIREVSNIQQRFIYNGYIMPEIIAKRYVSYGNMRNFYMILYYVFNIASIISSVFAIGYASMYSIYKNEKDKTKSIKIFTVGFSILALVFTSFNTLINPQIIAKESQQAWLKLEYAITENVYDISISNNEKDNNLLKHLHIIEKEMARKIYP